MDSLEAAALPQLALMCVGKVGLQLLCAFHVHTHAAHVIMLLKLPRAEMFTVMTPLGRESTLVP